MDENKLIRENIGLVYEGLKKMNFKPRTEEDWEDAFQVGLMGLLYGIRKYDESKSKPSTYYLMAIMDNIRNYYIVNSAIKRSGFNISLYEKIADDMTLEDTLISPDNIEYEVITKMQIEDILEKLKEYRNKRNIPLFLKYYGIGYPRQSIRELSKELGISVQAIYVKIDNIKRWLKKNMYKKKEKSIEELLKEML